MNKKILIIDDDENARALMCLILSNEGYDVVLASDGQSGVLKAMQDVPDLILLDIMMPNVDGYATCQQLKALPQVKEIPVLFLSALTEAQDKIRGLEMGGVDFVTKGGDRGELLARVRTQLTIRALTQELIQKNAMLMEKQQRLAEDLQAAALIQHQLLPNQELKLPKVTLDWKFLPCEFIGGDIFNAFQVGANHLAFYILDVSGHGVPSAIVSASISEILRESRIGTSSSAPANPIEIFSSLEKEFPFERFNRFITMAYLLYNTDTGKLIYSNAGHPPPYLLKKNGKLELLEKGGPLIGVSENTLFEEGEINLETGDKVILYTDGITEMQNTKGDFLGTEVFAKLLEELKGEPIERLVEGLFQHLDQFRNNHPPQDDVSFLGVEII
jgi:sigma-B regulation protein RsbU (phosphoserine phosphatase)